MKNKRLLMILGIVILCFVVVNVIISKSKSSLTSVTKVQVVKVNKQQMSDTLIASGVITPSEEETIYKDETMGSVKDIFVYEGQEITKDTELFRYDEEEIGNKITLLEIAKTRLTLGLEQQSEKLDNLEADFKHNLKDITLVEESIRQAEKDKKDLERQVKYAMLSIKENDMEMENLLKKKDKLVVKSTIAGVVEKVTRNAGAQEPMIHIVSNEPYKVKGTITEFDSVFVKTGQPVKVKAKVFSSEIWKGKVDTIKLSPVQSSTSSTVEKKESVTSYPFVVSLMEKHAELQAGYHVSVEIEIKAKDNALTLPHDATFVQDNKDFVFVVEGNTLYKKEITIGLMNDQIKEVLTGVDEEDNVVIHPAADWKEGMEVKVDAASK